MKLGSRRNRVGENVFLCLAVVVSFFGLTTSALSLSIDFDVPVNLDLKIDLKNITNLGDLAGKLADGLRPLLEKFDFLYTLPDTYRYRDPLAVIRSDGYEVTEEKINSTHGFILTAWRIRCKNCDAKKYPVLLQHGLFCSGADWLYLNKEFVLPYLLADAGYEVWIGNARGTKYSQGHTDLNTQDPTSDYWKHSVHEMGTCDVKFTIDTITRVSGKEKVNYVGYSMGTTMFFIYASEQQAHYAKFVNRFVGLAPAMYISKLSTQFKLLVPIVQSQAFHSLLVTLGKLAEAEVEGPLKYTDQVKTSLNLLNTVLPYAVPFVKKVLDLKVLKTLINGDPLIKNTRAWQRAIGYFPENISLRTVRHYVQFFANKKFGKFDHPNVETNRLQYNGEASPPLYNVGDVKVPSLFIGGLHDDLVVPADAKETADAIRNCPSKNCATVKYNTVPCFNHLDFIWGPNNGTKTLVYDQVLRWFDDTWDETYWPEVTTNFTISEDYCREKYLRE